MAVAAIFSGSQVNNQARRKSVNTGGLIVLFLVGVFGAVGLIYMLP